MNTTIEAIIFDLGRVLIDLDLSSFAKFLGNKDADGDMAALQKIMSDECIIKFGKGQITPEQFHKAVCKRCNLDLGYDEFAQKYCSIFSPIEGMQELVEGLSAKMPVGLLSDTDPLHWGQALKQIPFVGEIKNPTLSFEVGVMKPDAAIYKVAAENVGVDIDKCLFIDDRLENVDGAIKAGMQAIQFLEVKKLRQDLELML